MLRERVQWFQSVPVRRIICESSIKMFTELESNAPINVKPEGGGEGGSGNPRDFDCGVHPQGGDFDRTLHVCISSFNFIE